MICESPSLFERVSTDRSATGIEPFLDRHAREATVYGSGKVALRDGLANLVRPDENALLPAYLPDAVVEPFHELGVEPRYYAIEADLAPDLGDLESKLDDETAAVLSVDYFGFPTPGMDELEDLLAGYDCYHVDDNAHAAFSVHDGTLLGTRGHLGITSLWKILPIPDGAVLYRNDDAVSAAYTPSDCAGVADRITAADCRYVLKSVVFDVLDRGSRLRTALDSVARSRADGLVPGPAERYESGKTPMSKLSASVLEDVAPQSIRRLRRENYRAWQDVLADRDDVAVLYESLPPGICPQVVPVRAAEPRRFLAALDRAGVATATTWPRLSQRVLEADRFETATRLSQEIVVLPIHQQVDPSAIDAVGGRLR